MKKDNKRKTNLKTSILLLLLLLVLLIVSTYAWFTANKTVTVSDIEVYVAASNGLQISVDGTNWKTIITSTDILNATSTYSAAINQIPDYDEGETAKAVSSVLETDTSTGYMNMYLGDVTADETSGEYVLTATQTVEDDDSTSGDFVVFDIFLKVDADSTIYLTDSSYVQTLENTSVGLENAARVAFVYEGHAETGSTVASIQSLKEASSVILWEPNYDTHTAAGVSNAYDTYGVSTDTTGTLLSYYGVNSEISTGVALDSTDENYFSAVTPDIYTTKAFTEGYQEFIDLEAGITKFRVYMWIEGQDVDCENNASGSGIAFNVQFSTDSSSSGN